MRFPPDVLDAIRNRLPISAVVGRRVTFDRRKSQPARGDFWACCPFHKEKTPSFHCDDRRGIYHCFGCGATGDHFKFVTETEGLTFGEAVERLAEDAGVALPKPDPRDREREAIRVDLAGACEIAAKFFEGRLRSPEGKSARDYLVRRGLTDRTVAEFRIGYAPNERDALKRHLVQNGVTEETAIAAGLLIKPEDGRGSYDRFRGRLMIPIHDERGRVVAFGGRTLDPDGQPKYLNSPETPLFHKGTMLFNVHRAREAAHKSGTIIVTEGYLDAIAVHQAGIRNVVAALGTAFTEDHITRLWRFAPEPVICFDGDKAGVSAAHRAIDRILPVLKSGFSFNFCFLPDGQDPDDLVRAGGAGAFLAEISKALPLSEVLWAREAAQVNVETPERKAALERRIYEIISHIKDEKVSYNYRSLYRMKLSALFFKSLKGSDNELRAVRAQNDNFKFDRNSAAVAETEKLFLGLCVEYIHLFEQNLDSIFKIKFSKEMYELFVSELYRLNVLHRDLEVANIYDRIDPRYFFVLNDVHGKEDPKRQLGYGHKLRQRLPILSFHPHQIFIENVFINFLNKLYVYSLQAEIKAELGNVREFDDPEAHRIQAMIEEYHAFSAETSRQEKILEEEAVSMRKAVYPRFQIAA
jgi:DNA primase